MLLQSLSIVDSKLLHWLLWVQIRLTGTNRVLSALNLQIPEILLAIRLIHFNAIPALLQLNCTKVRSVRASFQRCSAAAVDKGHSSVEYGTAHSKWWTLLMFKCDCTLSDVCINWILWILARTATQSEGNVGSF